jgi:Flp pilus assembly protein TadD
MSFLLRPLPALLTAIAVVLLLYAPALNAPFVFDDSYSIIHNTNLSGWRSLTPSPGAGPVSGRPFLNLTFALNHALAGEVPWSYRLANCLIHALAGWMLYLILRQTLAGLGGRWSTDAAILAAGVAALWLVHPLQTESVTYISQRAESMAGFLYLLALYGFIRMGSFGWGAVSVASCLLGVATKETVLTAPLVILLYDATFRGGSVVRSLRQRWPYYAGLTFSWLLSAGLIWSDHHRGGTVGFGLGITVLEYVRTQAHAIPHYLWLCFHPWPLILDYGRVVYPWAGLWPYAGLVLVLLAATLVLWWRRKPLGFALAAFFLLLAPSSSFLPLALQTMAEHRMYLALAPVACLVVVGIYAWVGRGFLLALFPILAGLGALTVARNLVYDNSVDLWEQTVAHSPEPGRAENNLGDALLKAGRTDEAIEFFRASLTTSPDRVEAEGNLAAALLQKKDYAGALLYLQNVYARQPKDPADNYQIGEAYLGLGQGGASVKFFNQALSNGYQMQPALASGLGSALLLQGDRAGAIRSFEQAERLDPLDAGVRYNLAGLYWQAGQTGRAKTEYARVLQLTPGDAQARNNLGVLDAQTGDVAGAKAQFETSLQENPADENARANLLRLGQTGATGR